MTFYAFKKALLRNDGYYRLSDWGPFDSQWVIQRKAAIAASLGFHA
jgi:hypothetical protein